MLSHELRNPLAAIGNAFEILRLKTRADPGAERVNQIIQRQFRHLTYLVDDLLEVSRVMTGKISLNPVETDLRHVVEESLNVLGQGGMLQHHGVTMDLEHVHVKGDTHRLQQVVTNLVGNAAKYSEPDRPIHVRLRREGDWALLDVRDEGIGMDAETLARVFDLFYQAKHGIEQTQGGLGIGLTLTQRLVELHGGSVSATSPGPGRGSCFTVRLPLSR